MMSDAKISYVVFDIGDVLLAFRPRKYLRKKYDHIKVERLIEEVFHQPEFSEYEKGLYTSEELYQIYKQRFTQHQEEIKDIITHWESLNTYMEESWKLLNEIQKKGYPIYLLSNMGKEWKDMVFEKYKELTMLDGGVYSYEVQANKPDQKIFQALFDHYHLDAKEGIFIDDNQKNIDQANALGLHGIRFTVAQEVKKKLEKIL